MSKSNLPDLVAQGDERALLLVLLHEIYQVQRDLIDVRQALGIAREDELLPVKTEDWNGEGTPF